MSEFLPITITDVVDECKDVKTLRFRKKDAEFLNAPPGKYSMYCIPGRSANPFSFSYNGPPGITARKIDDWDEDETDEDNNPVPSFVHDLFELMPGNIIFATEPKGNSFYSFLSDDMSKDFCLIAGGCAVAPVAYLCEELCAMDLGDSRVRVLLGAKTRDEILFEDRIWKALSGHDRLYISTDDGSVGHYGYVTDLIEQAELGEKTTYAICGPEPMMKVAAEKLVREGYAEPHNILVLLERYMKCAKGQCSACDCGGERVCVDGPVFRYDKLQDNPHFGKFRRRKSGLLEPI